MLSPTRHGGQCIYCAFRTKRLALRSLRLGHQIASQNTQDGYRNYDPRSIVRHVELNEPSKFGPHRAQAIEGGDGRVRKAIKDYKAPDSKNTSGRDQRWSMGRQRSDAQRGPVVRRHSGAHSTKTDFDEQLKKRLEYVKDELEAAPLVEELRQEKIREGQKAESFEKIWKEFSEMLVKQVNGQNVPFLGVQPNSEQEKVVTGLRNAYSTRGTHGLGERLKYAFYTHLIGPRFTASDINNQRTLADLRYPSEWFPATRRQPRTIHLHVGPTNSGKTYHALQRLEQAESGIYAGPLRLLAHEVYTRMNAKGKTCALVTGEERRMANAENGEFGALAACTVEMMPLNRQVDVAVIDEIQMIGNAERGWAWTQAFLGVRAKEVHVCGEERTVPLVQEICASLGEKLHIHHYQRLSPLEMEGSSLNGKLSDLRKGDCIVSFSVMGIHALRRQIERETGKKVATVYGSLPPETRAQQARLFNDLDNDYDYLVASDAVGMGLNLAIKRIIFEASNKYDGVSRKTLAVADIKQIAGRAGRYRIATEQAKEDQQDSKEPDMASEELAAAKGEAAPPADVEDQYQPFHVSPPASTTPKAEETKGLITTLENFDYPVVRAAMSASPEPIRSAGLFPPAPILERFASYFPPYTPFSYILTRLHELSQMHPRFHLCGLRDQVWIADLIEPVKGLTIADRNIICSCPASMTDKELWISLMPAYASCIAEQTGGAIYDIEALPLEILEADVSASRQYLRELEQLHKGIVAYLWLSYRFAGVFNTRSLAFHINGLAEAKIEEVLSKFSFTEAMRRKLAAAREKEVLMEMGEKEKEEEVESAVVADREEADEHEDVEDEADRHLKHDLHEQTSLTSGGDHFAGAEDIGLEEPLDDEETEEQSKPVSSFAQWRQQETRKSGVPDTSDSEQTISQAAKDGEKEALEAFAPDHEPANQEELSVVDALPADARAHSTLTQDDKIVDPEQDPYNLDAAITPETELENDQPPLETQATDPRPTDSRVPDEQYEGSAASATEDEPGKRPGAFKQFDAGVPPKHLAHLDVDAKQAEQDLAARP